MERVVRRVEAGVILTDDGSLCEMEERVVRRVEAGVMLMGRAD